MYRRTTLPGQTNPTVAIWALSRSSSACSVARVGVLVLIGSTVRDRVLAATILLDIVVWRADAHLARQPPRHPVGPAAAPRRAGPAGGSGPPGPGAVRPAAAGPVPGPVPGPGGRTARRSPQAGPADHAHGDLPAADGRPSTAPGGAMRPWPARCRTRCTCGGSARALRSDSTVAEADIGYPTDAGLAGDAVR